MQSARPNTVYIVDDSLSIRTRIAEMLGGMAGIEVVGEAASASEAVAGILATRPDSVLLDLHLGSSNGMQVLAAVRAQAPEIVFVILTNHPEPQYRRACARAGAAYFLDKTNEFDRVRSVIAEIAATRH